MSSSDQVLDSNSHTKTEGSSDLDCAPKLNGSENEAAFFPVNTLEMLSDSLDDLLSQNRVNSGKPLNEFINKFTNTQLPHSPVGRAQYLDFLLETVVKHSINTASPRCLGHMSGATSHISRYVTSLIAALNQNVAKSDASKIATLVEKQTIAILHRIFYKQSDKFYSTKVQSNSEVLGTFTSGGTLANLMSVWCARNSSFPMEHNFRGVDVEGMDGALRHYGYKNAVVICSSLAHYSISKAVDVLGLGTSNLLQVDVDDNGSMSTASLVGILKDCVLNRTKVLAIVANAGTTDCGSIDPLSAIANLASKYSIHFHVDAAWGAPLQFSNQHRGKLAGIERADSITIDGHKQFHLPLGASLLLFRSPRLAGSIRKEAQYMLRPDSGDLGQWSLEGSRSAMSMLFHATLHTSGRVGIGNMIDRLMELTEKFAEMLTGHPSFELLMAPQTNIVVYRFLPRRIKPDSFIENSQTYLNEFNEKLQSMQSDLGKTFVSRTTLMDCPSYRGIPIVALRAVINNPNTILRDLQEVLNDQSRIANSKLMKE